MGRRTRVVIEDSKEHSIYIQNSFDDYLSKSLVSLRKWCSPKVTKPINNIIRSLYASRGGIEGYNFSELDLRGVNIAPYIDGRNSNKKTVFDDAYIERKNFFIEGPTDSICNAFFSHNDEYVVTTSEDGKVCVWDADTGFLKSLYKGEDGYNPHLFSMAVFHPNDSLLAVACYDGHVILLNSDTCMEVADIPIHNRRKTWIAYGYYLNSLTFDNSGDFLAVASNDSIIYIIDVLRGEILKQLNGHTDAVTTVKFSNDSKMLVSSSQDGSAIIWDVLNAVILKKFCYYQKSNITDCRDLTSWCLFADFTPSSDAILVSTNNHNVIKWNIEDNQTPVFVLDIVGTVADYIAFSPNKNEFIIATCFNEIIVCDIVTGQIIKKVECRDNNKKSTANSTVINSVAYNYNGSKIIIATDGGKAHIYDIPKYEIISTLSGHISDVRQMCCNIHKNHLATSSDNGCVYIWNLVNGKLENLLFEADKVIADLAYSNNGKYLVTATLSGKVFIYDVEQEYKNTHTVSNSNGVDTCEFSPNSEFIVTSSYNDTNVCICNAKTGTILKKLSLDCKVFSAEFSNNGRYVLVSGQDNCVYVFSWSNAEIICKLKGHKDRVIHAKFDIDDKVIVSASLDNTAIIWDFNSQLPIATLEGHNVKINNVIFNDNGHEVVTLDKDTVRLWNKYTGILVCEFGGMDNPAIDADFSNDGKRLMVLYDYEIDVLELDTLKSAIKISDEDSIFNFCMFDENEKIFVSVNGSYVYMYEINDICDRLVPKIIFDHNYNPKFIGCTFKSAHFDETFSEKDILLLRSYETELI